MEFRYLQGNMGEQPVAECFTLYKYIENKISMTGERPMRLMGGINASIWQNMAILIAIL